MLKMSLLTLLIFSISIVQANDTLNLLGEKYSGFSKPSTEKELDTIWFRKLEKEMVALSKEKEDEMTCTMLQYYGLNDHFLDKVINEVKYRNMEVESYLNRCYKKFPIELSRINMAKVGGKFFKGTYFNFKDAVSFVFGKTVGEVHFRKGYLYGKNPRNLLRVLKPFDVIVTSSRHYLTGMFIPGEYTHSLMYLGTKKQLSELGIWKYIKDQRLKKNIIEGNYFFESVGTGTRFASWKNISDTNKLSVLRISEVSQFHKDDYLSKFQNLAELYDTPYDFNLDAKTISRVACTEVIAHTFPEVNWKTQFQWGNHIYTPQDMLEMAQSDDDSLSLVASFKPGKAKKLKKFSEKNFNKVK